MANPIVSGLLAAGKTAKAAKPFYSAVDQALSALPAKALPDQMLKELLKQPGVKLQEVIDRKLDKALGVPIVEKTRTVNLKKPDKEGNTVKQEKYFEVTPSPKGAKSISKADVEQIAKERSPSMPRETVLRSEGDLLTQSDIDRLEHQAMRTSNWTPYEDAVQRYEAQQLGRGGDDIGEETKFAQYVVPGGSNYREIVLSYPSSQVNGFRVGIKHPQTKPLNYDPEGVYATRAEAKAAMDAETARDPEFSKHYEVLPTYGKPSNYKSSHFPDVNNYLAHARVSDRVGPNGEKILHVEEIQSDLHQEGRKKGYKTQDIETRLKESEKEMQQIGLQIRGITNRMAASSDLDEFNKLSNERYALYDRQRFLGDEGNALIDKRAVAVPDAPFKKNWHELVMKRIMDDAVKGGYDKVVITPGAEQAKRYDLSKQVDQITARRLDDKYDLHITGKNGDVIYNGKYQPRITAEEMENIVGKEMTQKIVNNTAAESENRATHIFNGVDLQVGGEGMKGFYDEMLPSYLNKYGEKYGAKVGSYKIPDPDMQANYSSYIPTVDDINRIGMQHFGVDRSGMTLDQIVEARNIFEKKISDDLSVNLHSFDITPQMREEITIKGQPLYQAAPPVAIGAGLSQEEPAPEPAPTYRRGGAVSQDAMNMAVWNHPTKRDVGGEAEPTPEEMRAALTPYVGNFYTGKRAQKDTEPAWKAAVALGRGAVAGFGGLLGDTEQIGRMIGAVHSGAKKGTLYDETVDTTPVLPTSEFYKEWLPFKDDNPYSELLTDVGGLTAGMGLPQIGKAGVAVGKLGAEAINAGMQGKGLMGKVLAPVAPMNVMKQKGGNWIAGTVDQMLYPLRKETAGGMDPAEALRDMTKAYPPSHQNFLINDPVMKGLERDAALNSFVDKQMTRYLKNEMSTPEDPIRLMAEAWPAQQAKLLESKQVQIDKAVSDMEKARQSRGFTPEMMTSSQARIRDLEKEKELIERQAGLHVNPEQLNIRLDMLDELQYGQEILGKSPTAKAWEGASDLTVNSQIAKDYLDARSPTNAFFGRGDQLTATNKALKENPWLSKVDPMTPVYYQQGYVDDIKFDHIIDELRNATNPASGLPKSLQIEAKDLAKYSMPQAVERVDKINAWRASQKAEADSNRANNAATFTVKEYPEGVSWKELKTPEVTLPEGYKILPDQSNYKNPGNEMFTMFDDQGKAVSTGATEAEAMRLYNRQERETQLADALKYEGEQLKHCVGGYCADVESGKSRIFSLRDAKGVPQVTIEVRPGMPPEEQASKGMREIDGHLDKIVQIKGANNRAPADKYLPMVHDFIKSGNWGEIKDLKNAGMFHAGDGVYITDAEAALIKKEKGMKRGGVVSQDAMSMAVMDKQLRKRNG